MISETHCPAEESRHLEDLLDGSLAGAPRATVLAHARGCAVCGVALSSGLGLRRVLDAAHLTRDEVIAAAWDGARDHAAHLDECAACRSEVFAIRAARPVDVGRDARFLPTALAAVLVAALGLMMARLSPRAVPATHAPSNLRGSARLEAMTPQGSLARDVRDLTFTWRGREGETYILRFFAEDGRPLGRIEAVGTRVVLGAQDRARLEAQPVFFWKVEPRALDRGVEGSPLIRVVWTP